VVAKKGGVWIDSDIACEHSPRALWNVKELTAALPGSDYYVCFTSPQQPTCGPGNSVQAAKASPAELQAILPQDLRVRGFVGIEVACPTEVREYNGLYEGDNRGEG
jgi:hypothetical protein